MNPIFFRAVISALATAMVHSSLLPVHAAAATPLSVASCSVVRRYEPEATDENVSLNIPKDVSVWVSFENQSDRTVTEVTFLVESPGRAVAIADHGWFSPGVRIRHRLGPFEDLEGDETCRLYSARFDDGLVWQQQP